MYDGGDGDPVRDAQLGGHVPQVVGADGVRRDGQPPGHGAGNQAAPPASGPGSAGTIRATDVSHQHLQQAIDPKDWP